MQRNITRTAILMMGIAFGFLIGCSTLSSSSPKKKNTENNLTHEQLRAELEAVERNIQGGGDEARLYYRKGYLLNELVQKTDDPSERAGTYREMREALKKAEERYAGSGIAGGNERVDELLKVSWSNEHNQGVQIMQSDSTVRSSDLQTAAAHFTNATIILPDTAISYKMEARAYYRNHNYRKAISTLERARNEIDQLPVSILEQLGFLYLEDNRPEKSIAVYEEAQSLAGDNLNIIHGLANAYIQAGNHQKAIGLLQKLVESQPENVIYRQTLANQYYLLSSGRFDTALAADNEPGGGTIDTATYQEADSLMHLAGRHIEKALSISAGNMELQEEAAGFYRNAIIYYQKVQPRLPGDLQPSAEQRLKEYITTAIPLFEKLTNRFPDNKQYWNSLYKAYTYLGMSEKAKEIESKIK